MRDPQRINQVIDLLEAVWKQYPDMRLGQLVSNAATLGGYNGYDIYNVEEDVILRGLTILNGGSV